MYRRGATVRGEQPLSDREVIEAHALRRRRAITAFVQGSAGGRESRVGRIGRGFWWGLAIAVLIALTAGVVGVVEASLQTQARGF